MHCHSGLKIRKKASLLDSFTERIGPYLKREEIPVSRPRPTFFGVGIHCYLKQQHSATVRLGLFCIVIPEKETLPGIIPFGFLKQNTKTDDQYVIMLSE